MPGSRALQSSSSILSTVRITRSSRFARESAKARA
jgi:hypothetical protein